MDKPSTVYVIYIATTPEKLWEALTCAAFTRQYFFGRSIELEQKPGGAFILRMPDGRVDVKGEVLDWDPPHGLSVTWKVDWIEEMRHLPECIVTYEIEPFGEAVRLTMTEAHLEPLDDKILEGGRQGWPVVLSSLKSLIETGKPIVIRLGPPKEMLEAARQHVARGD
jgi:uncharacterized protein YndB with AHSA1/START domain